MKIIAVEGQENIFQAMQIAIVLKSGYKTYIKISNPVRKQTASFQG
jgi:hypothetical protein